MNQADSKPMQPKFPPIGDIVLFEDENIIVLNKPAGLATETDNEPGARSLKDRLKIWDDSIQLCHRLDKGTTGALIGAKSKKWYTTISALFLKREITKVYHARVPAGRQFSADKIDLPILKTGTGRAKIDKAAGKPSSTVVTTIEQFRHLQLIEAIPLTGRFHQVRVHMSAVNSPLAGDVLYGGKIQMLSAWKRRYNVQRDTEELPIISRPALHAYSLTLPYQDGEILRVEAPYPKDFRAALTALRKYDKI